jgi:hypothetical protein
MELDPVVEPVTNTVAVPNDPLLFPNKGINVEVYEPVPENPVMVQLFAELVTEDMSILPVAPCSI